MVRPCHVYELAFPNGKKYIGISVSPEHRWDTHKRKAFQWGHKTPLYDAFRCYGVESISRRVLLIGSVEYCQEMEVKLIHDWETRVPQGYNLTQGGDMSPFVSNPELAKLHGLKRRGIPHSEETKAKMSLAAKGKPKSPKHRDSMDRAAIVRGAQKSWLHRVQLLLRLAFVEAVRAKALFSPLAKEH